MAPSPYRAFVPPAATESRAEPAGDGDLLPVLAILWVASSIRVALGLSMHEAAGVESTLAWLSVLAIPLLAVRGTVRRPRSCTRVVQATGAALSVATSGRR